MEPILIHVLVLTDKKIARVPASLGGFQNFIFHRTTPTRTQTSPDSGKSPGKKVTGQDIKNQQLAGTSQGEHSTEDLLRFDRDLEALGESMHPKDKVFARKMAAYGRPNNGAA